MEGITKEKQYTVDSLSAVEKCVYDAIIKAGISRDDILALSGFCKFSEIQVKVALQLLTAKQFL